MFTISSRKCVRVKAVGRQRKMMGQIDSYKKREIVKWQARVIDEGETVFIFSVAFSDKQWPWDINIKHSNKTRAHSHTHNHQTHMHTKHRTSISYMSIYMQNILATNIMCSVVESRRWLKALYGEALGFRPTLPERQTSSLCLKWVRLPEISAYWWAPKSHWVSFIFIVLFIFSSIV